MLGEFWLKIRIKFITISELILNIILPFHTTDLCKTEFSVVVIIKPKYRSIIKNIKDAICPTLSNICQDIILHIKINKLIYLIHTLICLNP